MPTQTFLADLDLLDLSRPTLIHSSFKALSQWGGMPEEWAKDLDDLLSPAGLLIPTFTGRAEDGPDDPPRFDPAETPGYTGALTEAARKLWGAESRSLHPTHSFLCRGRAAEWRMDHATAPTPCSPKSPLGMLAESEGQILLAGCGLKSLTLVHAAEEAAGAPYVMQPEQVRCWIKKDGAWSQTPPIGIHCWKTPRDYSRLEPRLIEAGVMKVKEMRGFRFHVIQAGSALELLTQWIEDDPACVLPY